MHSLLGKKTGVAQNQTFVTLVQIARQDPGFRDQILGILTLDAFNRKSALNSIARTMALQKAPEDLVNAVASLADDAIAQKALELITNAQ